MKRTINSYKDNSFARLNAFSRISPLHEHSMRLFPRFLPDEAARIFAPLGAGFNDDVMLAPLEKHWKNELPKQNALQYLDLMTFCSNSICSKTDSMAMAHSLEVRAPFLDRRIIEKVFSHPTPKYIASCSKPQLRKIIEDRTSGEILTKAKQGFSLRRVPAEIYRILGENLQDSALSKEGIVSNEFSKIVNEPGIYRNARIWTLDALARWYSINILHTGLAV